MSSGESTETLIRNPKDSAVIFGSVVVLAVMLEFMFSYFRNHRSSYVGGLFAQLSEETMIVGCISLLFVFVVQSFPNLPDSWVTIVRWAQGVIFFMIVFFVVGAAWTALITRIVCVMVQKFEFRLLEALTRRQNTEICDMLRDEWRLGGGSDAQNYEGDSGAMRDMLLQQSQAADRTVEDDLRQLLKSRVGDLGRLRQEFGATKELSLDKKPTSPEDKNRARLVEQFLGDAALRLQDYFLEGSQFTTGGLRDPEPESTLQSTLLVLRRVFLHQIRTKRYLPQPLQALLLTTEKLRLSSYILGLEAQRRELLSEWRTRRLTSRDAKNRDEALTYEDLIADRRRKARETALRRERSASSFVGDDETVINESRIAQQDPTESLKEGAQFLAAQYVGQRAQSWLVDGCLDPEVICRYVPFSKYLYKRMRTGVVGFVDITWQCWVSLVVVSSINSARLYVLPGKLQSKPVLETEDYRTEMFSFIFVIGYPPMIACIVTFVMLMRNFRWYLRSVKELRLNSESEQSGDSEAQLQSRASSMMVSPNGEGGPNHVAARMQRRALENTGKKAVSASVWLPPEQLAGQLSGDLYEDPSRYLIRGNKSFTLHTLKIPVLLTHFYFSMFVVKLWNTGGLGAEIVGYVALGVIPVLVVFSLLPVALFAVTCLMSLGLRIEHPLVCFTAARQCRRVAGKQQAKVDEADGESKDDGSDKNDDDEELTTLVAPLVVANARKRGDAVVDVESEADVDLASRNLVRRVLGFLPAVDSLGSPSTQPADDRATRNVSFLEASTALGDETTTLLSSTTRLTQAESAASLRQATAPGQQDALLAQLRHRVRTLEDLLSSSTGLEMPPSEELGTLLRSPNSMRRISSMRRKGQLGAQAGSTLEAPLLPEDSSDGGEAMRVLVDYYKWLLLEQAALVKRQRERIQRLEETHRGGVFHPAFHRQDAPRVSREGGEPLSQDGSNRNGGGGGHEQLADAILAARRLQDTATSPAMARPPGGAGASNALARRMLNPVRKAIDGPQSSPQK